MKVLHVFEDYPSTYQHYIIRVLNQLLSRVDSQVITFKGTSNAHYNIKSYGKKDILQRTIHKLGISTYKSSFEKIASGYQIIHIHHSYLFPKVINFLDFNSNQKVIITLRGGDTYLKPWISEKWSNFYEQYGNKVSSFIVVSNHQKQYLSKKWNIPKDKICIVPVSFTLSESHQPIHKNKETANGLNLISAFRMTWEKNIEGNLRVAKILKEEGVNFKYTICGDGSDKAMLYYFIDRYNLNNEIVFLGKVNPNDYSKILAEHDIYLQLSFSEALSASVIEAQGFGLPAIVSDADGIPETIIDKKTGYVIRQYDYQLAANLIKELWANPNTYSSFSKAAIQNIENKFSVKHEVDKLVALYQKILS